METLIRSCDGVGDVAGWTFFDYSDYQLMGNRVGWVGVPMTVMPVTIQETELFGDPSQ